MDGQAIDNSATLNKPAKKEEERIARYEKETGFTVNRYQNRRQRRARAKQSGVFAEKGTWGQINRGSQEGNTQTLSRKQVKAYQNKQG